MTVQISYPKIKDLNVSLCQSQVEVLGKWGKSPDID